MFPCSRSGALNCTDSNLFTSAWYDIYTLEECTRTESDRCNGEQFHNVTVYDLRKRVCTFGYILGWRLLRSRDSPPCLCANLGDGNATCLCLLLAASITPRDPSCVVLRSFSYTPLTLWGCWRTDFYVHTPPKTLTFTWVKKTQPNSPQRHGVCRFGKHRCTGNYYMEPTNLATQGQPKIVLGTYL